MGLKGGVDVAVLGGGVSGLAAALRLKVIAPGVSVAIIEAESRLGGKVCGEVIDGCIIDGGPDLCIESKLARTHAYHELSLASQLIPVNPSGLPTFRRVNGALSPIAGVITEGLSTMRSGMHDIVTRMVSAMPNAMLLTGRRVAKVERSGSRWSLDLGGDDSLEASAVICSLPAREAGKLLGGVLPALGAFAETVTYTPLTTVSAAWSSGDIANPLQGTGFIEAHPAEGGLTACTWTSSKIPSRSPQGLTLVRGYVRSGDQNRATELAIAEMSKSVGARRDPIWTRSFSWGDALPRYGDEHQEAVARMRVNLESLHDFALAGGAWDGVGIGDCILSGERAAARVASAFQPA